MPTVSETINLEYSHRPQTLNPEHCLQLALRCSVDAISFSAHADFPQTSDFLDEVNPPHVVLVHGEAGEMMRLKRALEQRAKATDRIRNLYTPKVTQPVHIRHQPRHVAKVCHIADGQANNTLIWWVSVECQDNMCMRIDSDVAAAAAQAQSCCYEVLA